MAKSRVGDVLYDKIFGPYTRKQWARAPAELAPEVTGRIPVRNDFDDRYFTDRYQALPENGYTDLVEHMLRGAEVSTAPLKLLLMERANCGEHQMGHRGSHRGGAKGGAKECSLM
jgi:UDP-galactopyranose mutase